MLILSYLMLIFLYLIYICYSLNNLEILLFGMNISL